MTSVVLGRFALQAGELLRLDFCRRIGLRCHSGRLLITAGREGLDHELHQGDSLLCGGGLVLVEGDGELLVERERAPFRLHGRERIELIKPKSTLPGVLP